MTNPSDYKRKIPAIVLSVLGLFVLFGWLTNNSLMVRAIPGSPAMAINTAFMFFLAGICLLSVHRTTEFSVLQKACTAVLIVLPSLILIQHIFDQDLGIDLAAVHSALGDGHSYPGRTAPNACIGFLFAGLFFYLQSLRPRTRPIALAIRILAVGISLIGISALLGYFLKLEAMYKFASFNRMALLTAFGMTTLGIGLWLHSRSTVGRPPEAIDGDEKRITRLAAAILTIFAVVAGLTGFATIRQGFEKSTVANIENTAKNNAFSISYALEHVTILAKSLASSSVLQAQLRALQADPDDPARRAQLASTVAGFMNLGFSGIQVLNAESELAAESGQLLDQQGLVGINLLLEQENGTLFWDDGLLLRMKYELMDGTERVGSIILERRLSELTALFEELRHVGQTSDLLLCGREGMEAVCLPSRFYPANTRIPMFKADGSPNLPISLALLGEEGASIATDLRNHSVLAGYSSLPKHALGLVLKTDIEELYRPLRDKLNLLLGLLVIFVGIGTLMLRNLVQPLIARILSEQQRMKIILKNSNDAFVAIDDKGRITDWNAQAEASFGWSCEEVIGCELASVIIPESRRAAHRAGFQKFLATGTGAAINRRLEVNALHRSGAEIPVELSIAAFHNGKGYAASAFLRDISERREAERQAVEHQKSLEEARMALMQSQKMEAVGKLTGGVAHDFNNVLQIIGGSLELINIETTESDKIKARVDTASAAVERGAKLSSQLLAFARRQPLKPAVTNLGRLVRDMHELLQRAIGGSVEIETIIAGGLWNTCVDTNQLEHVILNLAINARDAMQGNGKLTIEICNSMLDDEYARREPGLAAGQYVMLAISDTGCGMDKDTKARAFEPFFTTKREGEGTGLGLSMAYGFVKQSDGHIGIYSEPGHGTTIKIYLPRTLADVEEAGPALSSPIKGGSETILAVEDDASVQATVIDLLVSLGYTVLKASNGEQALRILEGGAKVDLLFTDVVMPGPVRSTELAKAAKILLPDLKVLFTSGYTQNAIVHGGRLDPGVHLLSKPYGREQLARKLRELLAK